MSAFLVRGSSDSQPTAESSSSQSIEGVPLTERQKLRKKWMAAAERPQMAAAERPQFVIMIHGLDVNSLYRKYRQPRKELPALLREEEKAKQAAGVRFDPFAIEARNRATALAEESAPRRTCWESIAAAVSCAVSGIFGWFASLFSRSTESSSQLSIVANGTSGEQVNYDSDSDSDSDDDDDNLVVFR